MGTSATGHMFWHLINVMEIFGTKKNPSKKPQNTANVYAYKIKPRQISHSIQHCTVKY